MPKKMRRYNLIVFQHGHSSAKHQSLTRMTVAHIQRQLALQRHFSTTAGRYGV
jgi:hypothetical protein